MEQTGKSTRDQPRTNFSQIPGNVGHRPSTKGAQVAELFGQRLGRLALLGAAILALCMVAGLGAPSDSRAGVSEYCNYKNLGGKETCWGTARPLYTTYGWGDNHSVCVFFATGNFLTVGSQCSSGPGVGVYDAYSLEHDNILFPGISNNAAGSNVVHGVALTH